VRLDRMPVARPAADLAPVAGGDVRMLPCPVPPRPTEYLARALMVQARRE
jgi:hypothetical protein